jgi:hypothetical protein
MVISVNLRRGVLPQMNVDQKFCSRSFVSFGPPQADACFSASIIGAETHHLMRAAPKARNMIARGKSRLVGTSPLVTSTKECRGLKGRNLHNRITPFQGSFASWEIHPGATRFALAPGYHISRLWRCSDKSGLAWLSYPAPLALF